jgi:hypothetical protein
MTDPLDPLEIELMGLRPHDVSPTFQERIGQRLAQSSTLTLSRRLQRLALGCGVAAACVSAVIFLSSREAHIQVPKDVAIPAQPVADLQVVDASPTLLAYRSALARSLEELDELLDKHAVSTADTNSKVCACPTSESVLCALTGER